ncbi:hypothetical protein STEG23_016954, partial [Scotinomys teguina]
MSSTGRQDKCPVEDRVRSSISICAYLEFLSSESTDCVSCSEPSTEVNPRRIQKLLLNFSSKVTRELREKSILYLCKPSQGISCQTGIGPDVKVTRSSGSCHQTIGEQLLHGKPKEHLLPEGLPDIR